MLTSPSRERTLWQFRLALVVTGRSYWISNAGLVEIPVQLVPMSNSHSQTYIESNCSNDSVVASQDCGREFSVGASELSAFVFGVAYFVLQNRADAEDVAQDALVKAYLSLASLRDRERFRAWIARIAWRLAINRLRANNVRTRYEEMNREHGHFPTAIEAVLAKERSNRLWNAIDRLPERFRSIVILTGIDEHEIAQVARLLDLPAGTVKSRLFRARNRLRKMLR